MINPRFPEDYFVQGYIEAALWADKPEDADADELSDDSYKRLETQAREFYAANERIIDAACEFYPVRYNPAQYAGHDFWLTRNGHGAGFWDRGFPHNLGDRLTELSEVEGQQYIYEGCDGLLHVGE